MIELIIRKYLAENLLATVHFEEPESISESYVILEKVGSSKENYIKHASIAIKSHSSTLYETAKLNEEVKKAMEEIKTLDSISSVEFKGDYNFTDTTKKRYRYQALYDLTYYD